MATVSTFADATQSSSTAVQGNLLVQLGALPADAFRAMLTTLAGVFAGVPVTVATADPVPSDFVANDTFQLVPYSSAVPTADSWILTAADYLTTFKLMEERRCDTALVLGGEAQSLLPEMLAALASSELSGADLTLPRYDLSPSEGLVNSAILYPVTRALFGTRPRYPLAVDLRLSRRMAERLAAASQRYTAMNQNGAIVWPVAEAAVAGFTIAEVPGGVRTLPRPDAPDLNTLLAQIAGSLFADVDAKASFWQRGRLAYAPKAAAAAQDAAPASTTHDDSAAQDVAPMLDSFRLAYTNLHEIWSLVLPPNSLLSLKKLSLMPPGSFRMPDALWVRIVYDFILAYRLRTINRNHLLGALTPLYLAWVASHLLLANAAVGTESLAPEKHIEALAAAFEADKPYLVSRWRWPDRFNP